MQKNTFCFALCLTSLLTACGSKEPQTVKCEDKPTTKIAEKKQYTIANVSFNMVPVEGGSFKMGAQSADPNAANYDANAHEGESPVHTVTLSTFSLGETEVTQALWKAVLGINERWNAELGLGDDLPAYNVSYNDVQKFLTALNDSLHNNNQLPLDKKFELPTEAQWEYAARGGKQSKGYYYAGSNNIDEVAWYDKNSDENIKPVAKKKANELGLFDMSGNVWEWCGTLVDHYTADAVTDPVATSGKAYALRGGGSHYDATGPRCGCRGWNVTNYFDSNLGFRLCLK
ncbi:MAG: formylglycine-generating enzyme family protein [Paludibacteraceae bacterium]|nr:formylglycine-generating enzyme family protein [Paludibacteraceae bacterium]